MGSGFEVVELLARDPLCLDFWSFLRSPVPAGCRVSFFTGLKKVTKESAFHFVGYGYCRFALGVNGGGGKNLCCAFGTEGGADVFGPLGDAGGRGWGRATDELSLSIRPFFVVDFIFRICNP